MTEFIKALEAFVYQTLIEAGVSVVERNSGDDLIWDDDDFRDDDELDQILGLVREIAKVHTKRIMQNLSEIGIEAAEDIFNRNEELREVLARYLGDFESDLRGGVEL